MKNAAAATKRLHDHINDKDEKIQEKWDEYKEAEKDEILRAKRYFLPSTTIICVLIILSVCVSLHDNSIIHHTTW